MAEGLRTAGIDTATLPDWQDGRLREASDEEILESAHSERRTVATYDLSSIPSVLQQLAGAGIDHSGVIFFSAKSVPQAEVGLQISCLREFARRFEPNDLLNGALWAKK